MTNIVTAYWSEVDRTVRVLVIDASPRIGDTCIMLNGTDRLIVFIMKTEDNFFIEKAPDSYKRCSILEHIKK